MLSLIVSPLGGLVRTQILGLRFYVHVLRFDLKPLVVDIQMYVRKSCHVNVRYPHQREKRH